MHSVERDTCGSAQKAKFRSCVSINDGNESDGSKNSDNVIKLENSTPSEQPPFRYRWQKKPKPQPVATSGSRDNERAYLTKCDPEGSVANTSKAYKRSTPKKRKAVDDDDDDDYPGDGRGSYGGRLARGAGRPRHYDDGQDEDGDGDWKDSSEEPSMHDSRSVVRSLARNTSSRKKNTENKTKKNAKKDTKNAEKKTGKEGTNDPHPNGRVDGRQLVHWHRARMVDKLVLHIVYECHRAGIKLPWDDIVNRLCPGSSGQTAVQHLQKMRDILVSQGHLVPPLLGRRGVAVDETIRGYVRDMDSEKPTDSKVLRWGEEYPDLKESLFVEGTVTGSGNYKREKGYTNTPATTIEKISKNSDGSRRNRLPKELTEAKEKVVEEAKAATEQKRKIDSRKKRVSKKLTHSERASSSETVASADTNDDSDCSDQLPSLPESRGAAASPAATLPVVLRLPSQVLQRFSLGIHGVDPPDSKNNDQGTNLAANAIAVIDDVLIASINPDDGSDPGETVNDNDLDDLHSLSNVAENPPNLYPYSVPDYGRGLQSVTPASNSFVTDGNIGMTNGLNTSSFSNMASRKQEQLSQSLLDRNRASNSGNRAPNVRGNGYASSPLNNSCFAYDTAAASSYTRSSVVGGHSSFAEFGGFETFANSASSSFGNINPADIITNSQSANAYTLGNIDINGGFAGFGFAPLSTRPSL